MKLANPSKRRGRVVERSDAIYNMPVMVKGKSNKLQVVKGQRLIQGMSKFCRTNESGEIIVNSWDAWS